MLMFSAAAHTLSYSNTDIMGNVSQCGIAKHSSMRAQLMGPDEDECLEATRDYLIKAQEEIRQSVADCFSQAGDDAAECKRRLNQLRRRWHPDKNPVLKELAGEVTKLLNEEVAKQQLRCAAAKSNKPNATIHVGNNVSRHHGSCGVSMARGTPAHADYVRRDASFEDYAVVA